MEAKSEYTRVDGKTFPEQFDVYGPLIEIEKPLDFFVRKMKKELSFSKLFSITYDLTISFNKHIYTYNMLLRDSPTAEYKQRCKLFENKI